MRPFKVWIRQQVGPGPGESGLCAENVPCDGRPLQPYVHLLHREDWLQLGHVHHLVDHLQQRQQLLLGAGRSRLGLGGLGRLLGAVVAACVGGRLGSAGSGAGAVLRVDVLVGSVVSGGTSVDDVGDDAEDGLRLSHLLHVHVYHQGEELVGGHVAQGLLLNGFELEKRKLFKIVTNK